MPFADTGNVKIYYELYGDGSDSIVFIMGLGMPGFAWAMQVPYFSREFKVLIFDNRGVGKSGRPPGPYSTRQMAEDTIALMDQIGIERSHIVGISMGGMIAQEILLNYPDRVKKAVLAATYARVDDRVRKHVLNASRDLGLEVSLDRFQEVLQSTAGVQSGETVKKMLDFLLPLTLSKEFIDRNSNIIKDMFSRMMESPPTIESFLSQVVATQTHDTLDRLSSVSNPVLVITGDRDLLVPPDCSTEICQRLKNCRLHTIKGGPHGINFENFEEFNDTIHDFLKE